MRLVTRCPACATTFKVVRDQLRISEGWVRCGRCSEVFDATLDLQETDDEGVPLGSPSGAAPAATVHRPPQENLLPPSTGLPAMNWPSADLLDLGPRPAPAPPAVSSPAEAEDPVPIPSLDEDDLDEDDGPREPWLDELMASTEALQQALQSASAAEREPGDPTQRQEPGFTPSLTTPSPIEEAVNAQLQKALRRERIKALRRERAEQKERERAQEAAKQAQDGETVAIVDTKTPASDDESMLPTVPLLEAPSASTAFSGDAEGMPAARSSRLRQVLLAVACLLALAALVLQVAREERDTLVAREPRLRPALQSLCDWSGCELSALRQIGAITIDGASFSREKEGDGYRLLFTLRNGARTPLAMPAIELTLLDTQERALVRRVLAPAQFGAPAVLAAGAEHGTSLPLQLTGSEAAGLGPVAGYRLIAFYP